MRDISDKGIPYTEGPYAVERERWGDIIQKDHQRGNVIRFVLAIALLVTLFLFALILVTPHESMDAALLVRFWLTALLCLIPQSIITVIIWRAFN